MITLTEPYDAPYNSMIQLPNPQLGDPNQINLKTIYKQNMSGHIYTHKATEATHKLVLDFRTLTLAEMDLLEGFYIVVKDAEIKYIDYNLVAWRCYFANDNLQITTQRDDCSYDCTIELIGSLG